MPLPPRAGWRHLETGGNPGRSASANAAALLYVAAAQTAAEASPVAAEVVDRLRDAAIGSICTL